MFVQPFLAPFVLSGLGCTGDEDRLVDCPLAVEEDYDSYDGVTCSVTSNNILFLSNDNPGFAVVACGIGNEAGPVALSVYRFCNLILSILPAEARPVQDNTKGARTSRMACASFCESVSFSQHAHRSGAGLWRPCRSTNTADAPGLDVQRMETCGWWTESLQTMAQRSLEDWSSTEAADGVPSATSRAQTGMMEMKNR